MRRPQGTMTARLAAVLLGTTLVAAACTSKPTSQAVESVGPSAPPAATTPTPAAPPSEAPSAAPATPAATTAPGPSPTPGIPGKPTKVTWTLAGQESLGNGKVRETFTFTWSAPEGVATRFTIVGVNRCLRASKQNHDTPCVVKGMRIPKSAQEVLATVPGTQRSADISWKTGEVSYGPYWAILIRASNDAGDSIFTIAWSDTVCWQCTY